MVASATTKSVARPVSAVPCSLVMRDVWQAETPLGRWREDVASGKQGGLGSYGASQLEDERVAVEVGKS